MLLLPLLLAASGLPEAPDNEAQRTLPRTSAILLNSPAQPGEDTIKRPVPRITQVQVYLDSTGKPERCAVLVSSGTSQFDVGNCQRAMQGKFVPATNDGMPVSSIWAGWFNWQIEDPTPSPPSNPADASVPARRGGQFQTANDYPSKALRERRQGVTTFRVVIGTNGLVMACQVMASSGHADLDDAACRNIITRARFKPARDPSRTPIVGSYQSRVAWKIP